MSNDELVLLEGIRTVIELTEPVPALLTDYAKSVYDLMPGPASL